MFNKPNLLIILGGLIVLSPPFVNADTMTQVTIPSSYQNCSINSAHSITCSVVTPNLPLSILPPYVVNGKILPIISCNSTSNPQTTLTCSFGSGITASIPVPPTRGWCTVNGGGQSLDCRLTVTLPGSNCIQSNGNFYCSSQTGGGGSSGGGSAGPAAAGPGAAPIH